LLSWIPIHCLEIKLDFLDFFTSNYFKYYNWHVL
jgi:hypothetical protein